MVTDRVGDFIVRLQNAAMVGKREITVPHSTHLEAIARKLKELGFIAEIAKEGEIKKTLIIALAFNDTGAPRLRGVKRISKPGRRLYTPASGAHGVAGGTGALILSTPKGVVSDREARRNRVGGETLFEIW